MWQPLGYVSDFGANVPVSNKPPSRPWGSRAGKKADLATAFSVMLLLVPATEKTPSANATSAGETSSRCAAIRFPFSITLSAAIVRALPPITVEREPLVPMPQATRCEVYLAQSKPSRIYFD